MVKAIRDNIVVIPCRPDDVSAGGIFIPENIRERSSKADVVSVGAWLQEKRGALKIGDTCFHVKGAGEEVVKDGVSYFVMNSNAVLAYIPK